jgi:hypothetical protein
MKTNWRTALLLLLVAVAISIADGAGATRLVTLDRCLVYGFAPGSRDYALCRRNLWRLWSSGPCSDGVFAFAHPGYCHLYPPLDF